MRPVTLPQWYKYPQGSHLYSVSTAIPEFVHPRQTCSCTSTPYHLPAMSYTIIVRTTDTTQGRFFLSEKTVWHYANGGTWSDTNGVQTLIMGGSGTSGGIRLVSSDRTEVIFVAVGVHNYKPWCDIVPDLSLAADTSLKVHPQYYGPERSAIREEQAVLIERTSAKGRKLTVEYTSQDKNVLRVHVTIA